jgi:hypothetical protein
MRYDRQRTHTRVQSNEAKTKKTKQRERGDDDFSCVCVPADTYAAGVWRPHARAQLALVWTLDQIQIEYAAAATTTTSSSIHVCSLYYYCTAMHVGHT